MANFFNRGGSLRDWVIWPVRRDIGTCLLLSPPPPAFLPGWLHPVGQNSRIPACISGTFTSTMLG